MKHVSGGVCKFAALLLMFALPAIASAPIITVTPFVAFVQPAGPGGCSSFDVYIAPEAGRPNKAKVLSFANGSTITTGATFVTATKLDQQQIHQPEHQWARPLFRQRQHRHSFRPVAGYWIPKGATG